MRHAVSEYNYQRSQFDKVNNKVKDAEQKQLNQKAFLVRRDLIDPPLHESGIA